jgi:endonuclease-3
MDKTRLARRVIDALKPLYGELKPRLAYASPFQLLAATILSAQCTDDMVNKVTPALFARFPDAERMAEAPLQELEALVRRTGFYRSKAAHLKGAASMLARGYGGVPPDDMEALLKLPGVGRKTANVILWAAYGRDAVIVDTHVLRVAKRLGLSASVDPEAMEAELAALAAEGEGALLAGLLNEHGRALCKARKPLCGSCPLLGECPSAMP